MTTQILQHIFSQEKGSRNTNHGINDVHEVGVGRVKILRQKGLDGMYPRFEGHSCQTRKYPNKPTQNQNEGLIAHVPESKNKQAGDEVGFSHERRRGFRLELESLLAYEQTFIQSEQGV